MRTAASRSGPVAGRPDTRLWRAGPRLGAGSPPIVIPGHRPAARRRAAGWEVRQPYHPSVPPDAPEGWERDEELQEALDAAQATPEEGGSAAGHLPRPLRRGFFSAGKG